MAGPSPVNRHCANCIGTLSFPTARFQFLRARTELATYKVLCHLAAVESGFAPPGLDEHVRRERLFDRVNLAEFHEHHLHVHRRLQSTHNIHTRHASRHRNIQMHAQK